MPVLDLMSAIDVRHRPRYNNVTVLVNLTAATNASSIVCIGLCSELSVSGRGYRSPITCPDIFGTSNFGIENDIGSSVKML